MKQLITPLFFFVPLLMQAQATWEQMDTVPAPGRFWAAATGNSTHGYAGTGRPEFSALTPTIDMYAYELATDTWTSIPDYPGGVREGMTGFTIGERIFFAFGSPFIQFTRTVYEYLPATNNWTQHPDVPGIGFAFSHGFVIDDTFYIGPENGTNQVYAFNATSETWTTVAPFPGEDRRAQCTFAANGKGYLGMGAGVFSGVYGDWWEYDPIADSWTEINAIFPNSDQSAATAVGNVGYVFNVGGSGGGGKRLFRYDSDLDLWEQDAVLPTDRIANGSLFTIAGKGFLVFGESSTSGGNIPSNQLWQFTPGTTGVTEVDGDVLGLTAWTNSDGSIRIRSKNTLTTPATVTLFDGAGKLLSMHNTPANVNVDISMGADLPSGLYHVQLRASEQARTVRVALMR